jgi:hypothetical protein
VLTLKKKTLTCFYDINNENKKKKTEFEVMRLRRVAHCADKIETKSIHTPTHVTFLIVEFKFATTS